MQTNSEGSKDLLKAFEGFEANDSDAQHAAATKATCHALTPERLWQNYDPCLKIKPGRRDETELGSYHFLASCFGIFRWCTIHISLDCAAINLWHSCRCYPTDHSGVVVWQHKPDDAPIPDSSPTTIFPGAEKTSAYQHISAYHHIIQQHDSSIGFPVRRGLCPTIQRFLKVAYLLDFESFTLWMTSWHFHPVFYISVTHSFVLVDEKIEAHHSILKIWFEPSMSFSVGQPWSFAKMMTPTRIMNHPFHGPQLLNWASFHCSWLRSHYLKLTKPWAPVPAQRVGVSEEKLLRSRIWLI